jgi:2-dehydropantoate 2-reductase
MRITVIGAGAIGNLVAGYLKLKDEDVALVGHQDSIKAINEKGLQVSGARGNFNIRITASDRLSFNPDLTILATKTQDIGTALKVNSQFLKGSIILTTQNGVQADSIVAQYFPKGKILSSIVMFGSTYLEPAKVVHNFEGSWIIGKAFDKNDESVIKISQVLNKIFPVIVVEDIKGMKYLKIFVNANNCIPAILGKSMQEAFSDVEISQISIAIWKEGLEVINKSGINLTSLPDFPLERLTKLTAMPIQEAAKIYSGIMMGLSKEPLYGSILQSIKRGKTSEIDYINGEFVRLAQTNGFEAPLNKKLVEMVHQVESSKKFFTNEELINSTKGLFN